MFCNVSGDSSTSVILLAAAAFIGAAPSKDELMATEARLYLFDVDDICYCYELYENKQNMSDWL